MRVFLTGASGFVGSHVLDSLLAGDNKVSLLLQRTSDPRFISSHLPAVTVYFGSLDDSSVLAKAISGQAVSGPGDLSRPVQETDEPCPVSVYGHSKLLGEIEIQRHSRVPWTILRPAAVYGPRDTEFLPVFKKVKQHIMPLLSGPKRPLHMVYGPDVAAATLRCLGEERAMSGIYHVAADPPCTDQEFMQEIARGLHVRPLKLRIPRAGLVLACVTQEILSRATRRPNMLSRQKLPDLLAQGWVCSTAGIRHALGFTAPTSLEEGVGRTIEWYGRQGWLRV
jgi:nucleoside-diphosphate-sugar epimerase